MREKVCVYVGEEGRKEGMVAPINYENMKRKKMCLRLCERVTPVGSGSMHNYRRRTRLDFTIL